MIKNVKDIETITSSVVDCGDVYFVPAFSGLYAPYWKQEARGYLFKYIYINILDY